MTEIRPYVFDENQVVELRYYGIRVFSSISDSRKLDSNKSLGRLIIFLGLCLIGMSAADLSKLTAIVKLSEQSIWPSTGKGIWIGFYVTAVGIFTLVAVKEKSHAAFHILLPYTIVAIVLCLFGLLTSIIVLDRYLKDPILSDKKNRNKEQGIEFALSGLLVGIFGLTFLFLSCLSCMICWTIPNFCAKHQAPKLQPLYLPLRQTLGQEIQLRIPASPFQRANVRSSRFIHPRSYRVNRIYR
ncbi:unnamed protein product [Rotaria socialis]|uniref:Uncharacterized protein n=1 Tax=Rotaria socialis TaxID=392032 RepID=A0A820U8Q9_9BILA|nr:unnamed protein product [Rotaria socialis]CAF3366981.1 unnamed protein product [Rotaria socialis]CAF3372667.1 unnamed protein product [Rotaria socialis]CAF3684965.1 unnamed protein product [Rotaria socialis]CAF3746373.1 unnamed protein product [Rotaria socialis]